MATVSNFELSAVHHEWPRGTVGNCMTVTQAAAAMRAFLAAMGVRAADFELQVTDAPLSGYLGCEDQLLTVRRRSTKEERLYSAGPHSSWLAQLLEDVQRGVYGVLR